MTDPRFAAGEPRRSPVNLPSSRRREVAATDAGTPREGWDHATGWYQRILGDVWALDLHVVEVELTLAEISPAMESLRPLAAELLQAGHESADKHGQLVGELVAAQ